MKLSESGFTGLEDFQDFAYPANPLILKILIQTAMPGIERGLWR